MYIDDKQIIQLFWDRNETAIKAASDKYGNYLNSIAINILENHEDAEECVNDTYMKAWSSIPPHKPEVLKSFLGKITRNLSFNLYKKIHAEKRGSYQLTVVLDELAECIPDNNNPEKEIEKDELLKAINCFLDSLPKEKRIMFVSRYWYCDSIADIANRFRTSTNNISVALNRLRRKLNNYLSERGFDL